MRNVGKFLLGMVVGMMISVSAVYAFGMLRTVLIDGQANEITASNPLYVKGV